LSFNAARVVSEKSAYLLPPNALATVIEKLLDELQDVIMPCFDTLNSRTGEIVRDPDWKALVNVSRIDLARNLRIPFQKAWLKKAIELQVPSYGRHTIIHRSAQGGWTVQNATQTDGEDRIYDKNAELRRHVIEDSIDMAEGLFRFESQLMKERLSRHGLTTLSRVNDERVWQALETRWKACKWGVAVGGTDPIVGALEQLELSQQESLLGFLHLSSLDAYEDKTTSHYKRLAKLAAQYGLTPGMELSSMTKPEYQLDLFAGELTPFVLEKGIQT
jgi:hypothetical protein